MATINPPVFRDLLFRQVSTERFQSTTLSILESWVDLCKVELDRTLTLDVIKGLKENAVFVTAVSKDTAQQVGYYMFDKRSLTDPNNYPRELLYLCVSKDQRARGKSHGNALLKHWELQHVNASGRNVDILLEIDAVVGVEPLPLAVPQFYAINRYWPMSIVRSAKGDAVDLIRMRKVLHVDSAGEMFVRLPRFAVDARAALQEEERYTVQQNNNPLAEQKTDVLRRTVIFGAAGEELLQAAAFTINNFLFDNLVQPEDEPVFVGITLIRPVTAAGAKAYNDRLRQAQRSRPSASESSSTRQNVARQRKGSRPSLRPRRFGQ